MSLSPVTLGDIALTAVAIALVPRVERTMGPDVLAAMAGGLSAGGRGGAARRADTTPRLELGPEIGRAVGELKKQRGVSTFVAIASAITVAARSGEIR